MADEKEAMALKNIEAMNKLDGFDVIIICCSSIKQAEYWQQRLEKGKGSILSPKALVFAVEEDWPGGAGNALGTLYAFTKASNIAREKHGVDLLEQLRDGKFSIGLYHTAGKGTRLAPLPGSENNNKPGVKLPATIPIEGQTEKAPMTILEAVIKQTGCYAKSRFGRLSVFWGDQIFIPTTAVEYQADHQVDILCSLGPMMTEAEWKKKGMDKYGLIAVCENGKAAQVEKVDHATAVELLSDLGAAIQSVGASLGSFSISWQILTILLQEFAEELAARRGKYDSDPHLWMPMTLSQASYLHLMKQKGVSEEESRGHYERIQQMMSRFYAHYPDILPTRIFGPVDVGQDVFWWDYGQLKLYQRNTLLMTEKTPEAEMMRLFFGITADAFIRDSDVINTDVQESCVSSSVIGSHNFEKGFVRNSVLSNVRCNYIEAENCVLINVTADRIVMKPFSIAYNVIDETPAPTPSNSQKLLELREKDVIVGVFDAEGSQKIIRSHMDTDGGKHWEKIVAGNQVTFEEVYIGNADACPTTLEGVITHSHKKIWKVLSSPKLEA